MTDQRIVELFFERSEEALSELSAKYGKEVRLIAFNVLKNESDAEECSNDAYLAVWNSIPPTKPESLAAYICRIARNIALKRLRANRAVKRNACDNLSLEELEEIGCVLPADEQVEDRIERRELTRALNAWLGGLDEKNLYIFMHKFWFFDPVSTIAKDLNVREGSVYKRLNAMREDLRAFLVKQGFIEKI